MTTNRFSIVITSPTVTGLTATVNSSTSVTLNWNAYSGATSYQVRRGTSAGSLTLVSTVASTTWTNTGHTAATTYFYRVDAMSGSTTLAQSAVVSATTSAASTYTPFFTRAFSEGANGNAISTFAPEGQGVRYTNEIAGPLGESLVGKVTATAGNNFFGGYFDFANYGGHIPAASLVGTDMWVRIYHYFPTAFCAGFGSTSGDGYGATKWLRFQWGTAAQDYWDGSRATFQLGNFSSGSCASASVAPRFSYMSMEGFPDQTGAGYFYWGAEYDYNGGPVITRNAWNAIQLQFRFGYTRATSFVRGWVNDTYIGQPPTLSATIPASNSLLKTLWIGDYWNGSPASTCSWYIGNIIATRQTPNTLDSGGRPYIAPTADARTWGT